MSKFQEDYKNYLYHSGFITEDELIHYGVPGMKWGVRKAQRYFRRADRMVNRASKKNSKRAYVHGRLTGNYTLNNEQDPQEFEGKKYEKYNKLVSKGWKAIGKALEGNSDKYTVNISSSIKRKNSLGPLSFDSMPYQKVKTNVRLKQKGSSDDNFEMPSKYKH